MFEKIKFPSLYKENFDVIYISYDEPNAESNYQDLISKVPFAKRVHGIKGFDKSHQKAAELSDKDFVFIIDGDNIVNENFLNYDFSTLDNDANYVLSWCSENIINGLIYGNGGVKRWPRKLLLETNCHDDGISTDWYYLLQYRRIPKCLSTTVCNSSPFQSFRTGFREGVKLCLNDKGQRIPGLIDNINLISESNRKRLISWMSVGSDVTNGLYCIYGARLGFLKAICEVDFNINLISDYEWFKNYWKTDMKHLEEGVYLEHFVQMGLDIRRITGLPIADLDQFQSLMAKAITYNPIRDGFNDA